MRWMNVERANRGEGGSTRRGLVGAGWNDRRGAASGPGESEPIPTVRRESTCEVIADPAGTEEAENAGSRRRTITAPCRRHRPHTESAAQAEAASSSGSRALRRLGHHRPRLRRHPPHRSWPRPLRQATLRPTSSGDVIGGSGEGGPTGTGHPQGAIGELGVVHLDVVAAPAGADPPDDLLPGGDTVGDPSPAGAGPTTIGSAEGADASWRWTLVGTATPEVVSVTHTSHRPGCTLTTAEPEPSGSPAAPGPAFPVRSAV